MDYYNLEYSLPLQKEAEKVDYSDVRTENLQKYDEKMKEFVKVNSEREKRTKLENEITKTAKDLTKTKSDIYKQTMMALARDDISPESVYASAKKAEDVDLQKVFLDVLETHLNPVAGRPNILQGKEIEKKAMEIEEKKEIMPWDSSIAITTKTYKDLKFKLDSLIDELEENNE